MEDFVKQSRIYISLFVPTMEVSMTFSDWLDHHAKYLAHLLKNSSQPFVIASPDGSFLFVNQAFCDLIGYTREELKNINWKTDLTPPEWWQHDSEFFLKLDKTGIPGRHEKEYLRKDGARVPVELLVHRILDDAGKIFFYYSFITDISARKKSESDLQDYRQHLENLINTQSSQIILILESITDGFFAIDNNWNFTYLNRQTEKFFNISRECLIGQPWHKLCIPEIFQKFQLALSTHQAVHFELNLIPLSKWAEFHAYPSINGLSVFFRDITEKKKYEQELSRLDMLNLVGQMAAGISHEVRNPLTTVRGFLQMLSKKPGCRDYNKYFNLMISELDRANDIISEFLALARKKPATNELAYANLSNVIKKICPLLEASALETGHTIDFLLHDKMPHVALNEKEIRQLTLNLVRNAADAMPNGGTITVKTYISQNYVVLSVTDQGHGIPANIIDKIGTPFFTTKETGTGLGLATCYSIAQRHGAKLLIRETGPGGTTFVIKFPLTKSKIVKPSNR